jgi:anion-transporting  ArsA/GET3 family ATPase
MDLSSKRLIFVTGKGGVGKSLTAAAIATHEARKGRRVCLMELGEQSFYETFFETRGIEYDPSEVIPQVHVSLLNPEESIREYVLNYIKIPKLYDLLFQNKVMKAFINAAPALPELAILGKLTSDIRQVIVSDYEVIVVDGYSTGHILALLRAPKGLSQTFRVGPLNEQALGIHQVISDPKEVKYVLVTRPEELPINEVIELGDVLKREFNADLSVVCNQISFSNLSAEERNLIDVHLKDIRGREFFRYLCSKEEAQKKQMMRLEKWAGKFIGFPQILINGRGLELIEEVLPYMETNWTLTNS